MIQPAKDLDFLQLEMDVLWGADAYGRIEPGPLAAIAIADDEWVVRFSADVPGELAEAAPGESDVDDSVAAVNKCAELLAPLGPLSVTHGPSYVVDAAGYSSALSPLTVHTSDQAVPSMLAVARPEQWWEPEEWTDLLAGRLGPWAIAMLGNRVAALCHTPRASTRAAEAGVWTHPDDRGRGFAAVITAAWAGVARSQFDVLFYSTAEHNRASQSVARKLGLQFIGSIWQIRKQA